jgi:two-component system, OmpR family, response regulator
MALYVNTPASTPCEYSQLEGRHPGRAHRRTPMEARKLILIVDDDNDIRDLLKDYLETHGFLVLAAANGREMSRVLASNPVDLLILDLMMPGDDGLTLLKRERQHSQLPVIILSARGEEADKVIGLELGADDFVAKPFKPRELLARVRSLLRRVDAGSQTPDADDERNYRFQGWEVDVRMRRLRDPEGRDVILTTGELRLLMALVSRPNRVLSRDWLLETTQGRESGPFDRSIDVVMSRLRQRLRDDPASPSFIQTVRGEGYLFLPRVERT